MADQHLERLLAELGERASAEIAAETAAGDAASERILAQAHADASARMSAAIAECDAAAARARATDVANARRAARGMLLQAQYDFVNRSLDRGARVISSRLGAATPAALAPRLDELLSFTTGRDIRVKHDARGIHIVADDGSVEIEDTIAAWMAQNRTELAIVVCRSLESGKQAGAPC